MRASARQYLCFLTIILACGIANAGHIAKRQSDDDSNALSNLVNRVITIAGEIPLVGGTIAGVLDWFVQFFELFEIATNGAIARFLGGALPCTVDLGGTTCTGLSSNGGFGAVLMSVIEEVPSLILPSFVKTIIAFIIKLFIDPAMDVIFGGVEIS